MPLFYLDASGIVKRYRPEAGSDVVDELLDHPAPTDRFHTSFLSVLEVNSGLRRLAAGGHIRPATTQAGLAQLGRDVRSFLQTWPLQDEIVRAAVAVVSQHLLKAADAIHLATALRISALAPAETTVLVTSDGQLAAAAEAAGLLALRPHVTDALTLLRSLRPRPGASS